MGKNYARPVNTRKLPNVFNKQQLIDLFSKIEEPNIFMGSMMALFCGLRIGVMLIWFRIKSLLKKVKVLKIGL
jgi:hypothetical protein